MSVTHADFTIERRYPYTPAQTFSAFADPKLKRQWFANPGRWDNAEWELDFRVGGGEVSGAVTPAAAPRVPQPVPRHRGERADHLRLRPPPRSPAHLGVADHGRVPRRRRRDADAVHRAGRVLRRASTPPPSASTGRDCSSTRSAASSRRSRCDEPDAARAPLRGLLLEGADRAVRARRSRSSATSSAAPRTVRSCRAMAARQHPGAGRLRRACAPASRRRSLSTSTATARRRR